MTTKLDLAIAEYQATQQELQTVMEQKQEVNSQLRENEMVKKELDLAADDTTLYKLIGPVLVKQELDEAVDTVESRIRYFTSEASRLQGRQQSLETSLSQQRTAVQQLQQAMQRRQ